MIVVTTPTGQIGSHLVHDLIDAGEAVRVVIRDSTKLDAAVRDQVDVVEGSHGNATVIDRALDGANALFWVAPPVPAGTMEDTYSGFTRPAAEAIARRGTGHIVVVTAIGRGTAWQDRAGLVSASIRMVDLLNGTGAAVRGLAMPGFMENALQQVDAIRHGRMVGTIDPARHRPHTATRDMAAAAARLLAVRTWSGQEDIAVLGPEDLSFNEIAAITSDVIGRGVSYSQISFDAFKAQVVSRGVPDDFAQGFVDMYRAKNEGMDNAASRGKAIIGGIGFRTWAEEILKPEVN